MGGKGTGGQIADVRNGSRRPIGQKGDLGQAGSSAVQKRFLTALRRPAQNADNVPRLKGNERRGGKRDAQAGSRLIPHVQILRPGVRADQRGQAVYADVRPRAVVLREGSSAGALSNGVQVGESFDGIGRISGRLLHPEIARADLPRLYGDALRFRCPILLPIVSLRRRATVYTSGGKSTNA